jgi:hypothetical protein
LLFRRPILRHHGAREPNPGGVMTSVADSVSAGEAVPGIEQVVPGRLETEHVNVTVPVKPFAGVTVTVAIPVLPALIVRFVGAMVSVKLPLLLSFGCGPEPAVEPEAVLGAAAVVVNWRDTVVLLPLADIAVTCRVWPPDSNVPVSTVRFHPTLGQPAALE